MNTLTLLIYGTQPGRDDNPEGYEHQHLKTVSHQSQRVLVVDDEPTIANLLDLTLTDAGFAVELVHDGSDALARLMAGRFSVLVLDIMLPDCNGLSLLRQMRRRGDKTPVLLISGRGSVEDKVEGLNAGADDYLAKPFALEELLARVRVLVRVREVSPDLVLHVAGLSLDTATRIARRGGRQIELTNREFRLLEYLMRSAGRICPRMMIIEAV